MPIFARVRSSGIHRSGFSGAINPSMLMLEGLVEARRRYPDDGMRLTVDREGCADEISACAESLLPQRVTEDHDRVSASLAVLVDEEPAQARLRAQQLKETGPTQPQTTACA